MDWVAQKGNLLDSIKKYRVVLLAALVGILLMSLPEERDAEPAQLPAAEQAKPDLEQSLARILSRVAGAGEVDVLLTQQEGERTLYQSDEDVTEMDVRRDTVLVTGADRAETGLIRQVNPPIYRGAIVLCQGADNAQVRLDIVEAVKSVTGLSSDHITVLKMK